MARLSDILIDTKKGNDGVDFPYDHGVVWRVARWGNPRFRKELQAEVIALPEWKRRKFQDGIDTEDEGDTLVRRTFAKTCLLGWTGIEDVEYSEEKAVELCCSQEFDAVYRELVAFSQRSEHYRKAAVEEASGNSSSISSGPSSGESSKPV